ncbi:MAG: lipoyl(octanoyl) transferase LipB [Nitrospira sp.]
MKEPVPVSHLIGPDITTSSCNSLRYRDTLVHTFPNPIPYPTAWELQLRLHKERLLNCQPDTLLILEHLPVYTLGRRTRPSDWGGSQAVLCENGAEFHHVNRGGSVTFHGPGQVVLYPILKLNRYATGARQLVWLLEEVVIRVLAFWNIAGVRIVDKPGVWVMLPEMKKICFVGIRIQQGVTLHGVSLNVDLDLAPFRRIHPCGFPDCSVTSMAAVSQRAVPVETIKQQLAETFIMVFPSSAPQPVSPRGQERAHTDPEGAPCRNF